MLRAQTTTAEIAVGAGADAALVLALVVVWDEVVFDHRVTYYMVHVIPVWMIVSTRRPAWTKGLASSM